MQGYAGSMVAGFRTQSTNPAACRNGSYKAGSMSGWLHTMSAWRPQLRMMTDSGTRQSVLDCCHRLAAGLLCQAGAA